MVFGFGLKANWFLVEYTLACWAGDMVNGPRAGIIGAKLAPPD